MNRGDERVSLSSAFPSRSTFTFFDNSLNSQIWRCWDIRVIIIIPTRRGLNAGENRQHRMGVVGICNEIWSTKIGLNHRHLTLLSYNDNNNGHSETMRTHDWTDTKELMSGYTLHMLTPTRHVPLRLEEINMHDSVTAILIIYALSWEGECFATVWGTTDLDQCCARLNRVRVEIHKSGSFSLLSAHKKRVNFWGKWLKQS